MKLIFLFILGIILGFNALIYSISIDVKYLKQKHPEVFKTGVYLIENNYIICGIAERYFDANVENDQILWSEAALDAKYRIYNYFQSNYKKKIRLDVKEMSMLHYWRENNRYFSLFLIKNENIQIIEVPKAISDEALDLDTSSIVPTCFRISKVNKRIFDLLKHEEFCNILNFLNKEKRNIECSNTEYDTFIYKLDLLCKTKKHPDDLKLYEELGEIFFNEKRFKYSYFYYSKYFSIIYGRELWFKNVKDKTLFNFALTLYTIGYIEKSKNFFLALRQFYPFGDYAKSANKYLEKIENNVEDGNE